jgi:hypothetical protein
MSRILQIFFLALVMGCQGVDKTDEASDLALINLWSGPYYPSLLFKVKSNGDLLLYRNMKGKDTTCKFTLSKSAENALLVAVRNAHDEIKQVPPRVGFADGWNIAIVLQDDKAGSAKIMNYPQGRDDWQFVPVLFTELHKTVPNKYW